MSEHKAPRVGSRVGVTLRSKAREIMFSRRREGTETPVKLTPGSAKWRKFEAAYGNDPYALDFFYTVHGKPPKGLTT